MKLPILLLIFELPVSLTIFRVAELFGVSIYTAYIRLGLQRQS